MIVFPNCKINLGLHVVQKRDDGFHNIETVFYPIPLIDALECIRDDKGNDIEFSLSGITLEGNANDNLCVKAYHLLKQNYPLLPAVKMHLHKVIPPGAGLGGGSADGAFALSLLNKKFNLDISEDKLIELAAQLGSDCPFFIRNKSSYATGRGEILEDVSVDLSSYKIIIVNPGIHISTGWAFSQLTPAALKKDLRKIIAQPITTWKNELINDFEAAVFSQYPEIKLIKESLYNHGALYAAMSGSGSTVFGIFEKTNDTAPSFPAHYFVKKI